ncbi:hypothetical protein [Nocardioides mesophilus]|uniref:Uncharacterized protein n=1 Tax=Nocardioides mesophilus TaxID=433659 RepID=A0A7G9RBQ5_9ACTN|nr:hypothetical protein [Nocardioides mesophilus]QNN53030.1 hypothetical protein H9L09_00535 [Nocardioides mesophilus]
MAPYPILSRSAAVLGVSAIVASMMTTSAAAADGDVSVVNTETVQVYTSPTGEVRSSRVYEQVDLTGSGSVELRNPVSTDGLRNLDGFGGWNVQDGEAVINADVAGEKRLRAVSNYDEDLPLSVQVVYTLDGKRVEPGDVVGEDGTLEVQYTVKNQTAEKQELTFDDGKGGTVTRTIEVPIPIVGSLTTVLPSSFQDVQSDQANMAGDGKGGTKLSFTMTLFPPIASTTSVFGYTADIVDGVIPRAEISALPVNPLKSPSFSTAADSYQGGAATGAELTDGATQIDGNLLKLRDGAADLLAGLIKLRDGSGELEQGLAGSAVPGSRKLADGAGQLDSGLGLLNSGARRLAAGTGEAYAGSTQLSDGAGRLDAGLNQLDGGVGDLSSGAERLAAGQQALAAGLKDLYDGVDALPESVKKQLNANPDYLRLLGTLNAIVGGIGQPGDLTKGTVLGGLNLLQYGIESPYGRANCDQDPLDDSVRADDCGAADGAKIISEKLATGVATINAKLLPSAVGAYDALHVLAGCQTRTDSLPPLSNLALADTNPCKAAAVAAFGYGLKAGVLPAGTGFEDGGLAAQAQLASDKLNIIAAGLYGEAVPGIKALKKALYNSPCDPSQTDKTAADFCGISQALSLITAKIPDLVDGITTSIEAELLAGIGQPTKGCDPTVTLRCAAAALADGGTELTDGVAKLVSGVDQLNDGGALLAVGAGDLSDGLGQIDDGASKLAAGTGTAKDGSSQLAGGADQLADGLQDAANGSSRLREGLTQAADGAPQLVDGASRLSSEGTTKLIAAGEDTAQNYGALFATMQAGAERADTEDMAFGAPEGAMGLTAYSFIIEGDDGESSRNLARGVGGLAVLGAGAGAFALRRRFI